MNDFIETQKYYSDLFKGYSILPKVDVTENILELANKYKNTSWEAFGTYLNRMKSALEASTLNAERRSWVIESLNPQIREFIHYENNLELWPRINEGDRDALKRRRLNLENNGFYNDEEDRWKADEAQGKLADWRDGRAAALKATILKIKMLDDRLAGNSAPAANPTPAPAAPVEDQQPAATANQAGDAGAELNRLFRQGFTVQHADELMKKLGVGPAYKRPTRLNAKIWALLFVLKDYNLLGCTPGEAAEVAGRHYGRQMAEKPSKVRECASYKRDYATLANQVKNDIAHKKYGTSHR